MKNFWILIITATLLSLPYRSSSSTERFRLLDTGNGLFNNQVRFLTQMEDGKILVCTEGMFNVYNGNSFEPLACDLTYTVPLGMHNLCTSYDGGNGLLWAKDFYRLYLINTRTGRFCHDIKERFEAARLTEAFNDFILDHDRNAWIITESGKLYRYDWKKPAKQVYEPRPEEKSRGIRVKEVMQAGPFHLIFLNTGRMLVWEEKSGRIVGEDSTVATPAPSEYFRTAWLQADKEHLLISVSHTEGYLYLYNIYTREWKEILKGKAINDIKKCKDGCFWLGGNQTLIKLSPRFELLQETHRLELTGNESVTDFIMSVLVDDRQGLWLGLSSSGILRAVPPGKYMEYYINEEVAHEEGRMIRSLCPYDGRHLLVGTMEGIYLFDTARKNYRAFHSGFSHLYCTDIKRDPHGAFWCSTRQGLYKIQGNRVERADPTLLPGLPSETVRFSLPLSDGSILVCMDLKDLYLCRPEKGQALRLNEDFPELNRSRAMSFAIEIKPGQLIIGGQNGLFGYEIARRKLQRLAWIVPWERYSTKYNCAYAEGTSVWIGTQNGLICHDFRTKETLRLSTENGLPNNCIQGITADAEGKLWVSTSNGIGRINRNADGTFSIARLDGKDGVQYGEMMEQSITAMPDEHVYVGGLNGITDIAPQATDYGHENLRPTLVGLRVMNHPINNEGTFRDRQLLPEGLSYTRHLYLKHNENFIEMKFSALDYDTPQHTHYRYRLEGVDKTWNLTSEPTGICTASYTSLTPGTYTLQVQAAMGSTPWGSAAEWQITVEPPLWKTWWAYAIYLIAALALLYYIIELYIADKRSRMMAEQENLKRQKEQHLDELKFRFFTNISHELRTPLALIITPLELLIRKAGDSALKSELEKILGNARDLLRLVNQLLDFRRLEQNGEQLKLSTVQIKPFIEDNVNHFGSLAHEQHIGLSCECAFGQEDLFRLDAEKMTRVLNNLLSNAMKFTPEGGFITVQAGWQEIFPGGEGPNGIHITVSDTGIGIPAEDLKNIFVRFYQSEGTQSHPVNTGSGIGLHLVKGYMDLHKGEITVESTPGKGTRFTLLLPAQPPQTAASDSQAAIGSTLPDTEKATESPVPEGNKVTVLVAEDNEQFRTFMKDLLGQDFTVLTAVDGQEGLAMAREYGPDLIISDVMMPHMDGYAFCRAVKDDVQCCHIPFILLTAKNSSESRSGAYEAGADSFIAKPFDIDVLHSRIRQLLEQRERRLASFRKGTHINPKEITITSLDEKLIQKALECIEKNMDNTEYNVEALSTDMGLERSSLYRKMQAIAGQTPTEFMHSIRLKRAARLLESGQYSVQEISWMVGFNTPRYFSSYFKEMFSMTPSAYAARNRKQPSSKA